MTNHRNLDKSWRLLTPFRLMQMRAEELSITRRTRTSARPRVFNVDLHIGVIRDLLVEFRAQDVSVTQWSISGHNGLVRRGFRFPDPVAVVNARTWHDLDENMIDRFADRYARFLRSYDGFVVTHTPAFARLFEAAGKPVLVVTSTRYEVPYSDHPDRWHSLNDFLRAGMDSGRLTVVANNRGDADYFETFVRRAIPVVPSVCDYCTPSPPAGNGCDVVMSRRGPARERLIRSGDGRWRGIQDAYGAPHQWADLAASREVFVVPYNVSTMTLFELATAGTPVAVPGRDLARELAAADPTVLSELSFFQVQGLPVDDLPNDDPNNYKSPAFLDWWLPRADFYNRDLMPNVRVVESVEELAVSAIDRRTIHGYYQRVNDRNARLIRQRHDLVTQFVGGL